MKNSLSTLPKVVFVGELQSGKTSLIRLIKGLTFESQLASTISGTFTTLRITYDDKQTLPVTIAEVGGSEQYKPVIPMFARLATIGFITVPLNIQYNRENLDDYINILKTINVPSIFLVGTKNDDSKKEFRKQFFDLAKEKNLRYFITSSKEPEKTESYLYNLVAEIGIATRTINEQHYQKAFDLISNFQFNGKVKIFQPFACPGDNCPFIVEGYKGKEKKNMEVTTKTNLKQLLDTNYQPKTEKRKHSVQEKIPKEKNLPKTEKRPKHRHEDETPPKKHKKH